MVLAESFELSATPAEGLIVTSPIPIFVIVMQEPMANATLEFSGMVIVTALDELTRSNDSVWVKSNVVDAVIVKIFAAFATNLYYRLQ